MATTTATSPYASTMKEVERMSKTWRAAQLITDDEVDLAQTVVYLCQKTERLLGQNTRRYLRTDDIACLEHEIKYAALTFLAQDFPACRKHITETKAWQVYMQTDIDEKQGQKTPVR